MAIHHSKLKAAMAMGCHLSQVAPNKFIIRWPASGIELEGSTPDEAIAEMAEVQSGNKPATTYRPMFDDESTIRGIPRNGIAAFHAGVPAADCPFDEGTPDFDGWNAEWDAAAEADLQPKEQPPKQGSVITGRYRAAYSEAGHPTHCGDALAVLLNDICSNKAGTNVELFERICKRNGVDLSRYNRTSKGWQGRLRMTGRNLLSKRIQAQNGRVFMPEGLGADYYDLGEDWVKAAAQKYKPKMGT